MGMKSVKNAAVVGLACDRVGPFKGDSGNIGETERAEADLDLSVEAASLLCSP